MSKNAIKVIATQAAEKAWIEQPDDTDDNRAVALVFTPEEFRWVKAALRRKTNLAEALLTSLDANDFVARAMRIAAKQKLRWMGKNRGNGTGR